MNTKTERFIPALIIIILFVQFNNYAQSSYEFGILPSLNLNKKLPKDWSINFKTESRQSLVRKEFNYDYLLTDVSFAASKKIGINTALAMGYLMRFEKKDGFQNRMLQQITFVKRYPKHIVAHRILADQTFSKNDFTELRLRYRISSEVPLQGRSLDPKEFFIKLSNEYLNSLYDQEYDLEIRGAGFLGYLLSPDNKIEFGLDYRINSFIIAEGRNRIWLGLNFYKSI